MLAHPPNYPTSALFIMYLYLVLLLAVVFCGKAPFIEPNQVHQAFSELEVNLILNENKNAVILMGVGRYEEDKEK